MASGFPSILWYNGWFIGNGGSGYVTALDSGLGQTFTVTFETPMDSLQSIAGGDWFIRRNKDPIQSIVAYSFAGVGQTDGFIAKSLVDSNNPIADFLKNTETVFPTYISTEEEPAAVSFDNSRFTMDDPTDTFDQG